MKSIYQSLLVIGLLLLFNIHSNAQSNPQALKTGVTIERMMTVQNGAIRVALDPVTKNLWYVLTSGEIYEVLTPAGGFVHDSLIYSKSDHTVTYVQGMVFHDSTIYISGNLHSDSLMTAGIIERGKLNSSGIRVWDRLMITEYYKTADYFDHLFSGITIDPSGDTLYICSGARGDHGEIQTRYGAYPGVRNVPLTTNIYCLPSHDSLTITLHNDSAWLAASGYVFSRGVRNHFDMAFDGAKHLFAVENSGDRDHNEEMNWLQRGHHYGFPWRMGDTDNPQQFAGFNPATDKLINHYSKSWRNHFWNNDPSFPTPPAGIIFDAPIQNFGPDCDKFRDSTGAVHDASDMGISMGSFTAHRSPLGLVFDNDSVLGPLYQGDGFMLSWTKGLDSCGCTSVPDTGIGPFVDPSQDLVHLDLAFDSAVNNFRLNATRIVSDFQNPVDAEIDSNLIYVIENGYGSTSGLFIVHLPVADLPCTAEVNYTCDSLVLRAIIEPYGALPSVYSVYNSLDTLISRDTLNSVSNKLLYLQTGSYYAIAQESGACPAADTIRFIIPDTLQLTIDSVYDLSQGSGMTGEIFASATGGDAPYQWLVSDPLQTFPTGHFTGLAADTFNVCVTDVEGCSVCDSVTIEDPFTGTEKLNAENIFRLFPNPTMNKINFQISKTTSVDLIIYDLNGKEIIHPVINKLLQAGENFIIDLSKLSPGNYTAKILAGDKVFMRKIIINK